MHLPNEAVGKVPTADRGAVWWSIPPTQNISCTLIRPEPDKTFRMSSIRGSLRSSVNEFSQHVVQRRALGLELEHRRALRNLVLQAGPYKLLHYLAVLRRRDDPVWGKSVSDGAVTSRSAARILEPNRRADVVGRYSVVC